MKIYRAIFHYNNADTCEWENWYYKASVWYNTRELAEALFLSDSFVAKLESVTHQTIAIDTLEEFARVLNVDIKDFFNEID